MMYHVFDSTTVGMIIVSMLFIIYVILSLTKRNSNEPPSPMALPLIGHLHLIGSKSLHIVLKELAVKYGDIFTLKFASREAVILCSRELIQEAFIKNARRFAGRPDLPTFRKTRHGQTGISLCDYSDEYAENRKATIRALHGFLGEKENLNNLFKEETLKMLELLDEYACTGKPFNPLQELEKIVPSTFLKLMFGISVPYADETFVKIVKVYKQWFEVAEADNPADFFPFLENFPNKRLDIAGKCGEYFEIFSTSYMDSCKKIDREKSLYGEFYMNEVNSNDEKMSQDRKLSVAKMLSDLIGGGFDTSASTLAWAILYLTNHPAVLEKCIKETRHNFEERTISLEHKSKYPYLCATIYEIIRLSTVAPLGLPRTVITDDTTLAGYKIKKGTMVMANLWEANRDAEYWNEPETLIPNRFLSKDGKFDQSYTKDILSFSSGIRRCPGEKIAFLQLFVVLGSFIKNYDINMYQKPADMLPMRGMTLKPKFYTVTITKL